MNRQNSETRFVCDEISGPEYQHTTCKAFKGAVIHRIKKSCLKTLIKFGKSKRRPFCSDVPIRLGIRSGVLCFYGIITLPRPGIKEEI